MIAAAAPGLRLATALGLLACLPVPASAAEWIRPEPKGGEAARHRPVPLNWFTVDPSPHVYRIEVTTPRGVDRVAAAVWTAGYAAVWVDGKRAAVLPAVPGGNAGTPRYFDLTQGLAAPGRHVVAVSAPPAGFAMDCAFHAGGRRVLAVPTGPLWRLAVLPPTTVLEFDAALKRGFRGGGPVAVSGGAYRADPGALERACALAALDRVVERAADTVWRAELLAQRGVVVGAAGTDWWGGVGAYAGAGRERARAAAARADRLGGQARHMKTRAGRTDLADARNLAAAVRACRAALDDVVAARRREDAFALARLTARARRLGVVGTGSLNRSPGDRLGWLPLPGLSDDDLGPWGARVHARRDPLAVDVPEPWRFRADPRRVGVGERWWSVGYNVEAQWLAGRLSEAPRDGGTVWFRRRLYLSPEWAAAGAEVSLRTGGRARAWLNDTELPSHAISGGASTWTAPPDAVRAGADNVLVLRIDGAPGSAALSGPVRVRTLGQAGDPGAGRVEVSATPLSPCVTLKPSGKSLTLLHAPGARLWLPGARAPGQVRWTVARDGRLARNGALLWLPGDEARPVLMVFEKHPTSISATRAGTRVTFDSAGARVVCVRPWARGAPPGTAAEVQRAVERWVRLALAVPVRYASFSRVVARPAGRGPLSIDNVWPAPVVEHANVYDYAVLRDAWGTAPLRCAPAPPLCGLALDAGRADVTVDPGLVALQDGGAVAPYRAVLGRDVVRYRYAVEPFRRRFGFTSWMFGGADVGVPGNKRELELVALSGANSYRPQHNFSDEPSPMDPKRGRLDVLLDAHRAARVSYTHNIDQTLGGPRERVQHDYEAFIDDVVAYYRKVASSVRALPFEMAGYDLINEPFDHRHQAYNRAIARQTEALREIDRTHLLYVEPCESWGATQQIALVKPTGDPLTVYSFHDYNFRLNEADDRWPSLKADITHVARMWLPAFVFQARHGVPLHCGEYGDFRPPTFRGSAVPLLLADFGRLFDQFGMHHHYYSGRSAYVVEPDGSLTPSGVVRFMRACARQAGADVAELDRWARPSAVHG